MKKIIRLTESDLARIVKRVIQEQQPWPYGNTNAATGLKPTNSGSDTFSGLKSNLEKQAKIENQKVEFNLLPDNKKVDIIANQLKTGRDNLNRAQVLNALSKLNETNKKAVYDNVKSIIGITSNIYPWLTSKFNAGYDSSTSSAYTAKHPGYYISSFLGLDMTVGEFQDKCKEFLKKYEKNY